MPKTGKRKKSISVLIVLALCFGLLIGCSSSKSVSANVNEKLELAVKYLSESNYQEAILIYQSVIKIDSKSVTAYKGLSIAYQLDNKMDLAEKALDDGLQAVPQTPQLKLAMAGLMLDQGKPDKSEAIYKELVYSDSPTLSTYQAYTYYLNKQGRAAEAIALLEQALTKNSKEYKLNSMLAELYYKNGNNEKALAAINRSMAEQIDQSASYKLLAEMYKDKWADLIALGEQYIQQSQTKTGQLLKLSGLLGMGRYDDVIKQYGELTSDLKDNARARLIAAQAYMKLSKKEQLSELLKPINVDELKDAGMLAELAAFYLETGNKDNARKMAMKGINQDNMVLNNYITLYNLYKNDDATQARLWLYKYILASASCNQSTIRDLINAGVDVNILGTSAMMERINSIEILDQVIPSSRQIQQLKERDSSLWVLLSCYVDIKANIAYTGYIFAPPSLDIVINGWKPSSDILWKPVVFRVHQPKINLTKEVSDMIINDYKERRVPEFEFYQNYEKVVEFDSMWHRVIGEGGSFEDHMKRVGIKPESITFIDF